MAKKVLFIVFVLLVTGVQAQTGPFNLDSLLRVSAGGERAVERLASVKSLYASGSASLNGIPGTTELWVELPDRIYYRTSFGPFEIIQAYNGQTAWSRDQNGMVGVLSGYERATLLSMVYFQTFSYLFDDRVPGDKEYLGEVEQEGRTYHKVAFYPMNEDTVISLFDAGTGYESYETINIDNAEVVTQFMKHEFFDEILVASESKAVFAGGQMTATMTIDSMAFDVDIDPPLFDPPMSERDFRFPEGVDSVVVPFKLIMGHIYVEASVNGRKLTFVLDSGASANLYHTPAVADMNLPVAAEIAAKGIAGYENVSMVQTDSVVIGDMVLLDQIGGLMSVDVLANRWKGDPPFGGILGYDLLSRFPIMVDYRSSQLVFYDPDRYEYHGDGVEVPFGLTMNIPTIEAELNGIPGRFLVDLGNALGIIVHEGFTKEHRLEEVLDDVRDASTGVGGIGGGTTSKTAYVASFSFGDVRINDLRVILSAGTQGITGSGELAGNIGNLVLQQFRVLFDYRNGRLVFYDTAGVSE